MSKFLVFMSVVTFCGGCLRFSVQCPTAQAGICYSAPFYSLFSLLHTQINSFSHLCICVCVCLLNTKITLHHIKHETDFGTQLNPEYFASPTEVYEFNNDYRNCFAGVTPSECAACSGYCDAQDGYGSQAYFCSDATTHVQQKFADIVNGNTGNYDWMNAGQTGCCVRGGGGQLSGNEYYRLACSCTGDGFGGAAANGYWKVFYFEENTCSTLVAESALRYSGYCGSASSVSVSLFASLAAVFAALKSM